MIYVKFSGGNGYCGCDFECYEAYDCEVDNDFLDDILSDMIFENAVSLSYATIEDEDDMDFYLDNATGQWEYITEQEYKEFTQ